MAIYKNRKFYLNVPLKFAFTFIYTDTALYHESETKLKERARDGGNLSQGGVVVESSPENIRTEVCSKHVSYSLCIEWSKISNVFKYVQYKMTIKIFELFEASV